LSSRHAAPPPPPSRRPDPRRGRRATGAGLPLPAAAAADRGRGARPGGAGDRRRGVAVPAAPRRPNPALDPAGRPRPRRRHADRAATSEMSFATFVMTNIIPQAANVNERAWAHLEEYCRTLVSREHDRLYVIAGPAGRGGRGTAGYKESIAGGRVTVPAQCWK